MKNIKELKILEKYKIKKKIKKIHFIGIGGIGMGGIAKIFHMQGYKISGSEIKKNKVIDNLMNLGIKIYFEHHKNNIKNADLIIKSNAIPNNNKEIIAAKKYKVPVIKRMQALSYLTYNNYSILITGTHGKTTTTSILIDIYRNSGIDPTFFNGVLNKNLEISAHLGKSKYFITEVDESEPSFLETRPSTVVITNIDNDHLNNYKGKFEKLKLTFYKFINKLSNHGIAILCIDDPFIRNLANKIKKCKIITYGFNKYADFNICNYYQDSYVSIFTIKYKNKINFNVTLKMLGKHNALNATAAIATATQKNIKKSVIENSIKKFRGVLYRFQNLGQYNLIHFNRKTGRILIIVDYGHHPTEIKNSIKTVKENWKGRKLIMIFQPHRYTRTKFLYKEFIKVLSKVDILIMLDIFSAEEKEIIEINSYNLCKSIGEYNKLLKPIFLDNINNIIPLLKFILRDNYILLLQGAGQIDEIFNCFKKNNLELILNNKY